MIASKAYASKAYARIYFRTAQTIAGREKKHFKYICENIAPFIKDVIELKTDHLTAGVLKMSTKSNQKFSGNHLGIIHPGVIATVIDHCGGFCAWSGLDDRHKFVSTMDLQIDYLRPANLDESLVCESKIAHRGAKMIRTDITCWNAARTEKIAIGRGLFNVYESKTNFGILTPILIPILKTFSEPLWVLQLYKMAVDIKCQVRHALLQRKTVTKTSEDQILLKSLDKATFRILAERHSEYCNDILGLKLEHSLSGKITMSLPPKLYLTGNPNAPCLHGGVTASLIEHCGIFCALSKIGMRGDEIINNDGNDDSHSQKMVDMNVFSTLTTKELRIDYLRPAPCFETVFCEAEVVYHSGRCVSYSYTHL